MGEIESGSNDPLGFLGEPTESVKAVAAKPGVRVERPPKNHRNLVQLFLVCGSFTIVTLVAAIWYVAAPASLRSGEQAAASMHEKEAVRAWLKENLDDSNFEEVKWSPAVLAADYWTAQLQEIEDSFAEMINSQEGRNAASQKKLASLKAAHDQGGKVLLDRGHATNVDSAIFSASRSVQESAALIEQYKSHRDQAIENAKSNAKMGGYVLRLKFRQKNPMGGKKLDSMVFSVQGGKASPAGQSMRYWYDRKIKDE